MRRFSVLRPMPKARAVASIRKSWAASAEARPSVWRGRGVGSSHGARGGDVVHSFQGGQPTARQVAVQRRTLLGHRAELPCVARPGVREQRQHVVARQPALGQRAAMQLLYGLLSEEHELRGDVGRTMTQWLQVDAPVGQPVKEGASEPAGSNGGVEVLIRSGDDAHVGLPRASPNRLDLAALERPQQLCLQVGSKPRPRRGTGSRPRRRQSSPQTPALRR